MTPVPRHTRRVMVLSLFCVLALASLASAQESAQGLDRVITVGVIDSEPPVWDVPFVVANPGDQVTLRADMRPSAGTHNIHVKGVTPEPKTDLTTNQLHEVTFTMPASGTVTFVCDAHPTMSAKVLTTAAAESAGAGGEVDVPHLGVNFLAYWVGLIAFALLFIVYGLTFFLFKYNETPTTTDQWDRSNEGPEGSRRFSAGTASILALVFAAVVLGAVIYLARSV